MSSHIRVVLADDHPAVRAGLPELLDSTPDIEVVGEAEDGQVAVELAVALRPDLVVADAPPPARLAQRVAGLSSRWAS